MDRRRPGGPPSMAQQLVRSGDYDEEGDGDDEDRTYERLVDAGVLDDVRALAESIVSCSSVSSAASSVESSSSSSQEERARLIADRLLEQNTDDVERALDAVMRDVGLADGGPRTPAHFRSWPGLLPALGPGRPARDAARALRALARLPLAGGDTYAGPHFRRLTAGLERAVCVDATFEPAARVYARLLAAAPDAETAAETFASLCAAAHLRCARRGGGTAAADPAKSVAVVCLAAQCLRAVCGRCAAHPKHVKPAVVEFVAAVAADADRERSVYAILCCADPAAAWFDPVAKRWSARTAFFQCLVGDRRLLKAVVSSFVRWMAEPDVPPPLGDAGMDEKRSSAAVVRYACALHAVHLLAKMFRYRDAAALFPVKVRCRATRVHAVTVADYCVAFLQSADTVGRVPATLTRGLCALVAAVAAVRPDVFDSLVGGGGSAASLPLEYRVRALAETVRLCPAAVRGREQSVDEIFARRHWKDTHTDVEVLRSLTRVAAALGAHHDGVWRLVTGRMAFLEAAAAADDVRADGDDDHEFRSLVTNVRGTPLASFTYHLQTARELDVFDWSDPRDRLAVGVACAAASPGEDWLHRARAFDSLNAFVERRLDEVAASLDPDNGKSAEPVLDVVYACCASIGGLKFLLNNDQGDDDLNTAGRVKKITELYHFSYEQFDGHLIARDVLVMLWLRLIEAATHSFSLRVYTEFKLKYQDVLTKLSAEKRTENGTVFVDETTELMTKLQRPVLPPVGPDAETIPSVLTEFLANADHGGGWLQTARAMIIRSDQISGAEMIDLIISYGHRRFDGQLDLSYKLTDHKSNLTDFDVTGIRLAIRYGSSVGLVAEDLSPELERLYGSFERPGSSSGLFDCMTCTLFLASGGSKNKCIEARAVLLKLEKTTRFAWPSAFDNDDDDDDRRAAFGHLVEGLLQQELPEVYNAFKMSGVSWWLLCSGWASDCFWGRLSWPEVCRWLCLVALSVTVDHQAFYFVCIAASRKRKWLDAFNLGRFREAVYQDDFGDFRLVDHADYLEDLTKKYHRFVSKRLTSEFGLP